MGLGLVAAQTFLDALIHGLLVAARLHVNEIKHDESAHVAQTKLAANFLGGFEVHLKDRGFLVAAALVPARVHVNRHQRLRFVNDDVAAALQMHLAREGVLQLLADVEPVKNRLRIGVELHLVGRALGNFGDHVAHPVMRLLIVHDNAFDVFGQKVAHGALNQIRLLENARRRRLVLHALLHAAPLFEQQREVADEITFLLVFAGGAHDDAHAIGNRQFAQDFFQPLAFLLVFNFARNAALIRIRQQHQITSRQNQVGRDARAFRANRTFRDLHDDFTARRVKPRDVLLSNLWPGRPAIPPGRTFDDFHAAVELVRHDVPIMQERIFLEADVHERGFEAVFEVAHLALENAADEAFLRGAFDVEFLQPSVFEHGDARFERLGVDDDFLVSFLLRPDEPLNLLHEIGRGEFDGVQNAFGLFRHGYRCKGLFLHHRSRGLELWLAEFFFVRAGFRRFVFRRSLRRQAGGDVFGALDFVRVPFFEHMLRTALLRHHVGASLDGFAVGFLLGLAEATFGAETHSAAPP